MVVLRYNTVSMVRLYPKKQTAVIFLICIIVVVGIFWYKKPQISARMGFSAAEIGVIDNAEINSTPGKIDGGGWQKQFLDNATNTVAFRNNQANSATTSEPLTLTDQLSREFLSKFMLMSQGGLTKDETTINNVVNQLTSYGLAAIPIPKDITVDKIRLATSADDRSLKNYGATLLKILTDSMPKRHEVDIADQALNQNDMTILKEIDTNIADYDSALSKLLSLAVPKDLVRYHLDIVNGMNMQLFNAETLRKLDSDPILALGAINYDLVGLQKISNALVETKKYFVNAGVPFGW